LSTLLVDLSKLKYPNTGLGQFCLHFGQELKRQSHPDFNSVFLLPRTIPPQFSGDRHIVASSGRRYLPCLNSGYDLWHSTHQDSPYFPDNKTPYLLTIHDLNFLWEKSGMKLSRRLKRLEKRIGKATAVVFSSEFTRQTVLSHTSLAENIPSEVIYLGVAPIEEIVPETPKVLPSGPFVFSIGVIKPSKNFAALVEWMAHMPDLNLVISGNADQPYADMIRKRIVELKMEDRIWLTGEVGENEKAWYYRECEAFVLASKLEGFGIPAIEAMRLGKPVFVSNLTSLPEVAGEEAFYWKNFDPEEMKNVFEEGMNLFTRDPDKKDRLCRHALGFSWEETAKNYSVLYQNLLKH